MWKWLTKALGTPGASGAPLNMRSFHTTDPALARIVSGGLDSASGKNVTVDTALQLDAVWACVRLISQTIATLPFMVFRRNGTGNRGVAADHPLYTLLHDQPNADMTGVEFWEAMVACVLLWGNAFAIKSKNVLGDVVSLTPIPPERVNARRQPDGSILYIYSPYNAQIEEIPEDDLFHIKGWSLNGLLGMSVIQYARSSLGTAMAADEAAGKFFANGLHLSGFIETGGAVMDDVQRERFKAELQQLRGSGNTGKTMLLQGSLKYNSLSLSPDDAQLLATREFSVNTICRWFQVDPSMIGHSSGGHAVGSALEQQMLRFLTLTLSTWLKRIEQRVKMSLIRPEERAKIFAEFNVEGLLRADSAGRAALYAVYSQNGLKTRNEIRDLENDPPMDGGDALTVQSNLVPLGKLGQQPTAQTPDGFGHPPPPQSQSAAQQPVRQ